MLRLGTRSAINHRTNRDSASRARCLPLCFVQCRVAGAEHQSQFGAMSTRLEDKPQQGQREDMNDGLVTIDLSSVADEETKEGAAAKARTYEEEEGHFGVGKKQEMNRRKNTMDKPYLLRLAEVAYVILPAGCYAFGGPAGVAVFYELFTKTHGWLTDKEFADLLALGNALPGPNTSIMATAMGVYRAGVMGGLLAFFAWSLPSLIVLVAAGMGLATLHGDHPPAWMAGLAPAAVVLIFTAFWNLAKTIVSDRLRAAITTVAAVVALLVQDDPRLPPMTVMWVLPVLLIAGGAVTLAQDWWHKRQQQLESNEGSTKAGDVEAPGSSSSGNLEKEKGEEKSNEVVEEEAPTYSTVAVPRWFTVATLVVILCIIIFSVVSHSALARPGNPGLLHAVMMDNPLMALFNHFFIVGITIYGGGQVILPVLINVCIKADWLTMQQFLEGFAIVQMLPGPLYNIGGYIGAVYKGLPGAIVGWIGLNLPSLLLTLALLPLWDRFRRIATVKIFLSGVNCAGLGLILSVGISLYLQVVTTPASGVVTIVTAAVVGYLGYSSLLGVITGGVVGFLLTSKVLNVGQQPAS